jgi:hypothetical protein
MKPLRHRVLKLWQDGKISSALRDTFYQLIKEETMPKPMAVRETKTETMRIRLSPSLEKSLQRYATANALTKSSAASMLIINGLKQAKF